MVPPLPNDGVHIHRRVTLGEDHLEHVAQVGHARTLRCRVRTPVVVAPHEWCRSAAGRHRSEGGNRSRSGGQVELVGKGLTVGPPKSRAGLRVLSIPPTVVEAVRTHLAELPGTGSVVFTVPSGAPIRRGNLTQLLKWRRSVERLGLGELHFHDLRHTPRRRRTPASRRRWRRRSPGPTRTRTRATKTTTRRTTPTTTGPRVCSVRPGEGGAVARAWPEGRCGSGGVGRYRRGRGPVTRPGVQRAGDGNRTRRVTGLCSSRSPTTCGSWWPRGRSVLASCPRRSADEGYRAVKASLRPFATALLRVRVPPELSERLVRREKARRRGVRRAVLRFSSARCANPAEEQAAPLSPRSRSRGGSSWEGSWSW